jgi:hypothetical protein
MLLGSILCGAFIALVLDRRLLRHSPMIAVVALVGLGAVALTEERLVIAGVAALAGFSLVWLAVLSRYVLSVGDRDRP